MIKYSFYYRQEEEKEDKLFNSFLLKMNGFQAKNKSKATKFDSFLMEQWQNHHYKILKSKRNILRCHFEGKLNKGNIILNFIEITE